MFRVLSRPSPPDSAGAKMRESDFERLRKCPRSSPAAAGQRRRAADQLPPPTRRARRLVVYIRALRQRARAGVRAAAGEVRVERHGVAFGRSVGEQ